MLSECASTKGIVKDYGPCVATQHDIKTVEFYGSISELCYLNVKIEININYHCHPYLGSARHSQINRQINVGYLGQDTSVGTPVSDPCVRIVFLQPRLPTDLGEFSIG